MNRYTPPPPEYAWLMGGLTAALEEGGVHHLGYRLSGPCLEYDDGSSSHWQLLRLPGGRAVVTGFDVDFSREQDVRELLAGGPGWLPRDWSGLTERIAFCFWWERGAGAWSSAPCPPDRGATVTGSVHDIEDRLFERAVERSGDYDEVREVFCPRLDALVGAASEARLGEAELTPVLAYLEDPGHLAPAAALAVATAAGFTPGSRRPELSVAG
ncbi:hypothetical protein [Kitasatospora sp. NPDC002965]|uniref:hypothetical protein n=1 Tax=Kitasatospora sp. NPDC002965 TaxID=3154775 RepID=UPI0033AAF0C9